MTNLNLTEKETTMLKLFVQEGINCCGFEGMVAEHLKEDNMTWMNANDLQEEMGLSKQAIGGIMGSLSDKGLICDSGESPRGDKVTDWYADHRAIDWFFDNKFDSNNIV